MTGDGNWTWLLPGVVPTLIDAGTGVEAHLDALDAALAGARLAQVLVTHAHTDHASGAPALRARFPGVRFRKMPWPARDGRWPVAWEPLVAGELVQAGDGALQVVHTPGHAPDHVCFWSAGERTLFCGDLAQRGNTVWIPARSRGDLTEYLASLDQVRALDPVRMLPAHGDVIDDPSTLLARYVAHRQRREAQVLGAVRRGLATPQAIADDIYRALSPGLLRLAEEGVLAHLVKLERERQVRLDGEAWHIMDA